MNAATTLAPFRFNDITKNGTGVTRGVQKAVLSVVNELRIVGKSMKSRIHGRFVYAAAILLAGWAQAQAPARQLVNGVVTKVDAAASELVLKTESGEIDVKLEKMTLLRSIPPGETHISKAVPIELIAVNPGDKVLAEGKASDDHKTLTATRVFVMSQGDLAKHHAEEMADWEKRGVLGLVTAVNPDSIVISVRSQVPGPPKMMIITPAANAVIKRYSAESTKFADAKPSTLAQILTGDQVRALGAKSDDGSKMTAEEIVSGSFRELAATIVSIDAADHEIRVTDLATKKPLVIKIDAESTLKKLPPQMAQMLAARNHPDEGRRGGPPSDGSQGRGEGRGFGGRGGGPGGDLTQLLNRVPDVTLAELKPKDAIIVLSTVGAQPDQLNVIKLLAGVEPILTKPGTRQMELGSWSLGGGMGEGGEP